MNQALADPDAQFFAQHPDRRAHIRAAKNEIVTDRRTRQTWVDTENRGEFFSLGPHERSRRRILLWRVPEDSPWYDPKKRAILKIPFLAFADETIEDTDEVLLPLIHQIMLEARTSG